MVGVTERTRGLAEKRGQVGTTQLAGSIGGERAESTAAGYSARPLWTAPARVPPHRAHTGPCLPWRHFAPYPAWKGPEDVKSSESAERMHFNSCPGSLPFQAIRTVLPPWSQCPKGTIFPDAGVGLMSLTHTLASLTGKGSSWA